MSETLDIFGLPHKCKRQIVVVPRCVSVNSQGCDDDERAAYPPSMIPNELAGETIQSHCSNDGSISCSFPCSIEKRDFSSSESSKYFATAFRHASFRLGYSDGRGGGDMKINEGNSLDMVARLDFRLELTGRGGSTHSRYMSDPRPSL